MSSFLDRDLNNNQVYVSKSFKEMYHENYADKILRDSHILDLLGEMQFDCGRTRWDSPILWTHMPSRKIVIAIQCPKDFDCWVGCPYKRHTMEDSKAFICDQGYEIRVKKAGTQEFETKVFIKPEYRDVHWFCLPYHIRKAWENPSYQPSRR